MEKEATREEGQGASPSREEPANAFWCAAFLDELARGGVRYLCVAPGSRSTPLILAGVRDGRFSMVPVLDERSAGFFALGLGKVTGQPAAVVTTSGTAAANLFPAVIEASQGETPLLVLTADRPHRLRDADANQTMDQVRLFGTFPRAFFDVPPARLDGPSVRHLRAMAGRAVAMAKAPPAGPVHLNFPFDKPLEPEPGPVDPPPELIADDPVAALGRDDGVPFVSVSRSLRSVPGDDAGRLAREVAGFPRGVIVAGPVPNPLEVGPAVLTFAAATGFPVLADPLSGARFSPHHGAHLVGGYDLFLRSPEAREALTPDLVVRIGAAPTSAAVLEYLDGAGPAPQVVVDDGHRWKDHLASATEYIRASPGPLLRQLAAESTRTADPHWRLLWEEAESIARRVVDGEGPGELLEGEILGSLARYLPEGSNLLVASSMPIRDLDAFVAPSPKTLRIFGNRGVSGIDGLVSTALGIAAGAEEGRTTAGVLGDQAFFHDMNGLLLLKSLELPVILVVINNDGGGIFHTLPVRRHEPAFSRFFATPHGLDFSHAAELYGIHYEAVSTLPDFEWGLERAMEAQRPAIVEVRTRRQATHERRRKLVDAVVRAMAGWVPEGP